MILSPPSTDRNFCLWDAYTGRERSFVPIRSKLHTISFNPDGKTFIGVSDEGVGLYNAMNGGRTALTKRMFDGRPIAHDQVHQRIAMEGSAAGTIEVIHAKTGATTLTLRGILGRVRTLKFSPDGKRLVSACVDKSLTIWDAINGDSLFKYKSPKDQISDVAFDSSGLRLAIAFQGKGSGSVTVLDARPNGETAK
jgi:WD40 repeat protein